MRVFGLRAGERDTLELMPQFRTLLRRSALIAAVLFVPIVFIGFALINPHGFHGSIALFFVGAFLLMPFFLLYDNLAPHGPIIWLPILGMLQFLWVFAWAI